MKYYSFLFRYQNINKSKYKNTLLTKVPIHGNGIILATTYSQYMPILKTESISSRIRLRLHMYLLHFVMVALRHFANFLSKLLCTRKQVLSPMKLRTEEMLYLRNTLNSNGDSITSMVG